MSLNGADLSGADFTGANLSHAILGDANLRQATLSRADLSQANLSRANLSAADLVATNLQQANLAGADLSGADLTDADVYGATLSQADLVSANLSRANLSAAYLAWADLCASNLHEANLYASKLHGADFTAARIGNTIFAAVDPSACRGLEAIKHQGPSAISIDTVYKSAGYIPEPFLRGAGVPDNFIAYMGSLVVKPVEFYSCFISYSMTDDVFAERLYADLQGAGVRCWFAPKDVRAGRKLHEQIDEAIRVHDKLLLIVSRASMASEWVKTEIAKSRKRERRERRRVLFPVRLVDFEMLQEWECFDADAGKDSAREIREYFIPDFSRWRDEDSCKNSFERLVRDLKAEAQRPE